MFQLLIYLYLLSHICVCFWIRLSDQEKVGDHYSQYISTAYYLFTTSSTVGYGDFTVDHDNQERFYIRFFFQIVLMYFAVFVNGMFYAFINKLTSTTTEVLEKPHEEVSSF